MARQEIRKLRALGNDGRSYVVLAITPIETLQTFHGLREERGRLRYELNDGTAIVALSERRFRVERGSLVLELVSA